MSRDIMRSVPTSIPHIVIDPDGGMRCTRCGDRRRMSDAEVKDWHIDGPQGQWVAQHKNCKELKVS